MDNQKRIGLEAGLRSAAVAGDEAAWRALYDAHAEGLRKYVDWRCGGLRSLGDDVIQDVWLTVVRRIASFDPGAGNFAAWISGIAALTIRNHLRKHHRTTGRQQTLIDAPALAADPHENEDRSFRLAQALDELPSRYEMALRAKYVEQMSVAQIADSWNESPKAVESVLTRAREQFRTIYERGAQS
jgi:RNA polymerase sigma-70 factor (ECF subfamily)